MGLIYSTEEKFANLIIKKHVLETPFNIEELVQKYATLFYKKIPISGVDGVSINIKIPGKIPKIILNADLSAGRKLFTLAHELGHLIIPWHTGTIVDNIYNQSYKDFLYQRLEHEANQFAAQLLMPRDYVLELFETTKCSLAKLQENLVRTIGVSTHAAAIRISQILRPEIIFIAVEDGKVLFCGKTPNTNANFPASNEIFDQNYFPYYKEVSICTITRTEYHWYDLNIEVEIETDDEIEWRHVLNEIVEDIKPPEGAEKFKKTINGKVSFAHGSVKKNGEYNISSVFIACLYRMKDFENKEFINHKNFELFLKLRALAFINKK